MQSIFGLWSSTLETKKHTMNQLVVKLIQWFREILVIVNGESFCLLESFMLTKLMKNENRKLGS